MDILGSRSRAARRVALTYVTAELMPVECSACLPLPAGSQVEPAFAFMLALLTPDMAVRDYAISEPELTVTVDANRLAVLGHERWREPVQMTEPPVSYWCPPAVRSIASEHRDRLEAELFRLADDVAMLYWEQGALAEANRPSIERFNILFRFLTPVELLPFYRRLNPDFLDWLEARTPSQPPAEAPEPAADVTAPPQLVPDPWDAGRDPRG